MYTKTGGTYDENENKRIPETEVPRLGLCGLVFDYKPRDFGTEKDSRIQAGDRQLLLAVLDKTGKAVAEPAYGTVIQDRDGKRYLVELCKPLSPAGVPVLFDIQLRRS
jgi:hypothetical protein